MNIKPIETIYKGYRFRSRLEARWAVFFDACGIAYEYEPEGFTLDDGTNYLPDFYLPEFELYVEIKPFDHDIVHAIGDRNIWEQKCAEFRDSTDMAILLCYGQPADHLCNLLFTWDTCDSGGGSSEFACFFVEFGEKIVLCTSPTRTDRDIYVRGFESGLRINDRVGTPHQLTGDFDLLWDRASNIFYPEDPCLKKHERAFLTARQARFEFGETPNIQKNNDEIPF